MNQHASSEGSAAAAAAAAASGEAESLKSNRAKEGSSSASTVIATAISLSLATPSQTTGNHHGSPSPKHPHVHESLSQSDADFHQELLGKQQQQQIVVKEEQSLEDSAESLVVEDIMAGSVGSKPRQHTPPNLLLEQSDATLMTTNLKYQHQRRGTLLVAPSPIEKLRAETSGSLVEEAVPSPHLRRRRSYSLSSTTGRATTTTRDSSASIHTFGGGTDADVSWHERGTQEPCSVVNCQQTPGQGDVTSSSSSRPGAPAPPKRQPRRRVLRGRGEDSFSQGLRLWENKGQDLLDSSSRSGSMSVCLLEFFLFVSVVWMLSL